MIMASLKDWWFIASIKEAQLSSEVGKRQIDNNEP